MKTLKGNGPENTTFKGAINPGSNLAIESASIGDVNVYGSTLSIPGGVVLSGVANTSGTAVINFTGGTIATGGCVIGSAVIGSAVLGSFQSIPSGRSVCIGSGASMFNMNANSVLMEPGCKFSALGVVFSGGYALTGGILRTSAASAYYSGCVFSGNICSSGGILFQINTQANVIVSNCLFKDNIALANMGIFCKLNNGSAIFDSCTITGTTSARVGCFYISGGGMFTVTNCIFTSNLIYNNQPLCHIINPSFVESCVFSANSSTATGHSGRVFIIGSETTLKDCYIEPLISSPTAAIYTSATGSCIISGGTCGTIQNTGKTVLNGNIDITYISSGTVDISSGASIALTSNISATTINVNGGCTVNGASVAAGTYTKIDSNGNAT